MTSRLPPGVITFGPKSTCNLDVCPVEWSVYRYRPSLAANSAFIALFGIAILIHAYLGIRSKSWFFMGCMITGCISGIIGYVGRVMLWYNPFSFKAFMMQIVCVTTSPVWFCAAIYVTLAAAIMHFSPTFSRFNPQLFYWVFIPCDIVSLVLQAVGGALSTSSAGSSAVGVNLALAGLAFQVFCIVIFCALFGDYLWRYLRSGEAKHFGVRMQAFFGFTVLAVLLIVVRCVYRLVELREGYQGDLIHDEPLYIGLEGIMTLVAVYALMIGHPGLVFNQQSPPRKVSRASSDEEGAMRQVK